MGDNPIRIWRLAHALGAEVAGVDFARPLAARVVDEIRRAWLAHGVLVFPGVDITLEQHVAFSRCFGEPQLHPIAGLRHPRVPEIVEVTNRVVDGQPSETAEIGRVWHSDGAYTVRPPTASLLHCHAIPSAGGTTWFNGMTMAYEALSPVYRRIVDGLEVVNDLHGHGSKAFGNQRAPEKVAQDREAVPPVVQPMVRTHPETGRKALYLNPAVTRGIVGMTDEESRPVLDFLFQHCVQPQFLYCHRWRVGDLVMWDNRCTMHLAPADFDRSELRLMMRTTLAGEPHGRLLAAATEGRR